MCTPCCPLCSHMVTLSREGGWFCLYRRKRRVNIKGQPTASATHWAGKEEWTLVTAPGILAGRCPFPSIFAQGGLHDPVPLPLCSPLLLLSPLLTLLQPREPPCCSSGTPNSVLPQGLCTASPPCSSSTPLHGSPLPLLSDLCSNVPFSEAFREFPV